MAPPTITVTLSDLASQIDHSLLPPNLTDAEIRSGLDLCKRYGVASACVKPYSVPDAVAALAGTDVRVCAVVGFPHGGSVVQVKALEATTAVRAGAAEVDMVVNVGKVLSGEWGYVEDEIATVNEAVLAAGGAVLKVIFETHFLRDCHVVRLCAICTHARVAFVKTSTGFAATGATVPRVALMRRHVGPNVAVKAAGGVRSLDDFLYMMHLGTSRIGTSATDTILSEAKCRGIGHQPVSIQLKAPDEDNPAAY